MLLFIGAFLGFFAVGMGTFTEHSLKSELTDDELYTLLLAIRYNQIHALIITLIGAITIERGWLASFAIFRWSAYFLIFGVLLFSFSVYLQHLFKLDSIKYVMPIGGFSLMLGWVLIAATGISARR